MSKKTTKKRSNKATLVRVTAEMAEPRMAKSVRDRLATQAAHPGQEPAQNT